MGTTRKPYGYWTIERVVQEALKYNTKKSFRKGSNGAYCKAYVAGILDEVCSHMQPTTHSPDDLCIVYEFRSRLEPGKDVVYVGITNAEFDGDVLDVEETLRTRYRTTTSEIQSRVFINNGVMPTVIEGLEPNGIARSKAMVIEREKISENVIAGHVVLNTMHNERAMTKDEIADVLNEHVLFGCNDWSHELLHHKTVFRWREEDIMDEGKLYSNRTDFARGSPGAYAAALRLGILDDVCYHMTATYKPRGYWTAERMCEVASRYKNRTEFKQNAQNVYVAAQNMGILDDICSHMVRLQTPNGYWDLDSAAIEAKKYDTRTAFKRGCNGAYNVVRKSDRFDEICKHMKSTPRKPRGYWNADNVVKEAKKYETRFAFAKGSGAAYTIVRNMGLLDELFPKST